MHPAFFKSKAALRGVPTLLIDDTMSVRYAVTQTEGRINFSLGFYVCKYAVNELFEYCLWLL
jgi:hypothetical protein